MRRSARRGGADVAGALTFPTAIDILAAPVRVSMVPLRHLHPRHDVAAIHRRLGQQAREAIAAFLAPLAAPPSHDTTTDTDKDTDR